MKELLANTPNPVKPKMPIPQSEGGYPAHLHGDLKWLSNGCIKGIHKRPYASWISIKKGMAYVTDGSFVTVLFDQAFDEEMILNRYLGKVQPGIVPFEIGFLLKDFEFGRRIDFDRLHPLLTSLSAFDQWDKGVKLGVDFSYNTEYGVPNIVCDCAFEHGILLNPWTLKKALVGIPKTYWPEMDIRYQEHSQRIVGCAGDSWWWSIKVDNMDF